MLNVRAEVFEIVDFEHDLEQSLSGLAKQIAKDIHVEIETSLEKRNHSGRSYQRGYGRVHIASAPGETPARDSGDLWGSLTDVKSKDTSAEFEITAGHAGLLETGTSKMAERPFVAPAVDLVLAQTVFEL